MGIGEGCQFATSGPVPIFDAKGAERNERVRKDFWRDVAFQIAFTVVDEKLKLQNKLKLLEVINFLLLKLTPMRKFGEFGQIAIDWNRVRN